MIAAATTTAIRIHITWVTRERGYLRCGFGNC